MLGTTARFRPSDGPADTVLRGPVRVDATSAPTDALAIRHGRVVALGRRDCAARTGPATEVVDVDGVVAPAFVDAHVHPVMGGLNQVRCDLDDVHDLAAYRARIREHADRGAGSGDWLVGSGWYGDVFPGGSPTAAELDALTGDRPAVLTSHDVHSVWANTAALRRAGIDGGTPDPAGGRIERNAAGEPTGLLMESAAALVTDLLPEPTEHELREALLQAQAYLHSVGVAGWQDAAVGRMLGMPDLYPVYRAADDAGLLTARVTGALWWDLERDESQIDGLLQRRTEAAAAGGRFAASAVKIMQDGVCENLTAAVLDAYRDEPHDHGLSFLEPARLREVVAALAAERFDVHLHAVGDRAVRECLDAVEAGERGWSPRHQVAHIDLVHPDDVARFATLDVIANVQPLWAREDRVLVETKLPHLTDAQREQHFAFGTLHRAGARLAFGSDWPVSSPVPLWAVHVAVNRTAPQDDPHAQDVHARTVPLLEREGVDVATAFHAATAGAAHASRLDANGTLHLGMHADLVVLDRDPLAVPPGELSSLEVRATHVAGRPVHQT